jgi:hypothetical protein
MILTLCFYDRGRYGSVEMKPPRPGMYLKAPAGGNREVSRGRVGASGATSGCLAAPRLSREGRAGGMQRRLVLTWHRPLPANLPDVRRGDF